MVAEHGGSHCSQRCARGIPQHRDCGNTLVVFEDDKVGSLEYRRQTLTLTPTIIFTVILTLTLPNLTLTLTLSNPNINQNHNPKSGLNPNTNPNLKVVVGS